jgi:poly-D-alanine transfer protein DltD
VEWAKVPWLDFRADEEDPYFLTDPGLHLSARGWVFADRALDMFWHGRSSAEIRSALSTLAEEAPSGSPPADHR